VSSYLQKLQTADDATKRRYGALFALIIMAIVIYIWLAYFNTIITPVARVATVAPEEEMGFSFWDTVSKETASVYNAFANQLSKIKEMITKPKEYEVMPRQ
jgi:hypothetical protein